LLSEQILHCFVNAAVGAEALDLRVVAGLLGGTKMTVTGYPERHSKMVGASLLHRLIPEPSWREQLLATTGWNHGSVEKNLTSA
jgi:hypothetical protein